MKFTLMLGCVFLFAALMAFIAFTLDGGLSRGDVRVVERSTLVAAQDVEGILRIYATVPDDQMVCFQKPVPVNTNPFTGAITWGTGTAITSGVPIPEPQWVCRTKAQWMVLAAKEESR